MIEPPAPGFTGVVWEARPTDRLARELTSGPGSVPLVEAATAWAGLAAGFGAAVADYDRIIAGIRAHWRSDTSELVLERLSAMRSWLTDTAGAAARNAERAATQAAAYEVARLAMPHTAEIAAMEQALRMIQAVGASLGGPMVGFAAEIDADRDAAKTTAARVMRTYEAATEPLAQPWQQSAPPPLSTPEALEVEQAARPQHTTTTSVSPSIAGFPVSPQFTVPRTLAGARVHTVGQLVVRPEILTTSTAATPAATGAGHALPAAPLAAAAAQGERDEHTPQAAPATTPGTGLELEAGAATAPPVLGGVDAGIGPAVIAGTTGTTAERGRA